MLAPFLHTSSLGVLDCKTEHDKDETCAQEKLLISESLRAVCSSILRETR